MLIGKAFLKKILHFCDYVPNLYYFVFHVLHLSVTSCGPIIPDGVLDLVNRIYGTCEDSLDVFGTQRDYGSVKCEGYCIASHPESMVNEGCSWPGPARDSIRTR